MWLCGLEAATSSLAADCALARLLLSTEGLELAMRQQQEMQPPLGIEPRTFSLQDRRSATEL